MQIPRGAIDRRKADRRHPENSDFENICLENGQLTTESYSVTAA